MLKPGDTFERYTIDAVLGQGGMGTVYRAHDTRLERRVAIKVITDGDASDEASARLLREARAAAALDHPNAVSIFDVGEVSGAPYIAMELVTGRTLREAMGDASADVDARVGWLGDVARALAAAHKKGLVHRDTKPENVMVRDDGVVKVLDFGIARRSQGALDPSAPTQATALPTLTKEGIKVGTPLYMAPEQIRSEPLDGRADQFAWGVVAYEVLTGKLPWRGVTDPLAAVASILTDQPDGAALDAAGVPAEVKAVVLRALAKKPEERFASMDDVVRALDPSAKSEASSGRSGKVSVRPSNGANAVPPGPAAQSATMLQRYSTADVRAILERAIDQQEDKRADSRLGFDDLLAAAREVGVDDQTLREASRELRVRAEASASNADFATWKRRKKRGFHRHLVSYLAVSIAMVLFALLVGNGAIIGMAQVPIWWGIGILIHGARAYMADEDDWREEREKEDKKERKRQRRREVVDRAIEQGASVLLDTGAAIRRQMRVSAGHASPARPASGPKPRPGFAGPVSGERVRIASDTDRAAEAEADAVLEEQRERRRR